MSDSRRVHRAIKKAILQLYPTQRAHFTLGANLG